MEEKQRVLEETRDKKLIAQQQLDPFYECSRFERCSVNNCPLHPLYPNLYTDPDDPETKCKLPKSIRVKIAANYPGVLKYGGMTTREWAAKKRYESLTMEERENLAKIGIKALKTHFCSLLQKDLPQNNNLIHLHIGLPQNNEFNRISSGEIKSIEEKKEIDCQGKGKERTYSQERGMGIHTIEGCSN